MTGLMGAFLIGLLLVMPALVFAQLPRPTVPVECTGIFCGLTLDLVGALIQRIAQFLITIALVIAVIFIIWGGISWMAAGGTDERVKAAKKRILNGIIGAAIVLGIGVILSVIGRLVTGSIFG